MSTYFAESVYRECDVLLVDEADLIMVQCDREFAPAQVLVDATDTAFIDRLRKVISPISPGASHIGRNVTSAWVVAAYHTLSTTIQVYNRVQTNPRLLIWIGRNPFTGRTLFGRVVSELVDLADETNSEEQITQKDRKSRRVARAQAGPAPEELRRRRARLMDGFRAILEHDIYAPETGSIGDLARRLLHNPDSAAARADVATWCQGWFEGESELAPLRGNARLLEDVTSKVEIALLMTLLEKQLTAVVDDLPAVRRAVDPEDLLEGSFSRPARDYLSVVPEAPVGNITGFTFRQEKRADGPSNLKLEFSRYVGTGRAFLLQFPELFTADRWQGPHTVLVSGTSYAPGSTAHHIPVRPDGILEPLRDDGSSAEEAIAQSEFTFRPQRTLEGKPIRISGLTPGHRAEAVRNMVTAIASPRGRAPSLLQQCQEDLAQRSKSDPQKWNGRSLIGLVLTNYEEADAVSTMLRQTQGVRGQVSAMRRDNAAHTLHGPRRGQLGHLDEFGDLSVLTLVFGAFERGHNPLTADRSKSIFGSLLFVPRPMPVPGDWLTTVQALNAFAWEYRVPSGQTALQEISAVFNHKAHTLLMGAAIWGSAFWQLDDEARRDLAMTMIVRMWQVIGRGIRGNVPVKIDFLDAQFAPEAAVDPLAPAVRQTSLLAAMRWVLQGYIEGKQGRRYEQTLVRRLYGSFYYALSRTGGMRFDDETDFIARI
ncbi:MAG TPA: hypothetical protein VD973_22565 [Symbiobacteriaceae bacterium]|nr:hypothetical protein [Symbiobacteriaceae bacterium]